MWGMENFDASERQLESFKPDNKQRVIIDNYKLTYTIWKRRLKELFCWFVIIIMVRYYFI